MLGNLLRRQHLSDKHLAVAFAVPVDGAVVRDAGEVALFVSFDGEITGPQWGVE